MERKLFSLLAAGLVFLAAVWGGTNPPGRLVQQVPGPDVHRFGRQVHRLRRPDHRGALQLCPKCSAKRHQCEHCLAATTDEDEAAAQSKPADPPPETAPPTPARFPPSAAGQIRSSGPADRRPQTNPANRRRPAAKIDTPTPAGVCRKANRPPSCRPIWPPQSKLKPINPAKAGTYTSGKWRYQIADYQLPAPADRRPLGLADLRRPEIAAGRRQRLLQYALGSDLLGRCADDRLGSPRLDAGPSGAESDGKAGHLRA